jgi:hypothetical protein
MERLQALGTPSRAPMTFDSSFGEATKKSRRLRRPVYKDFRAQARPQPSQGSRRLFDRGDRRGRTSRGIGGALRPRLSRLRGKIFVAAVPHCMFRQFAILESPSVRPSRGRTSRAVLRRLRSRLSAKVLIKRTPKASALFRCLADGWIERHRGPWRHPSRVRLFHSSWRMSSSVSGQPIEKFDGFHRSAHPTLFN